MQCPLLEGVDDKGERRVEPSGRGQYACGRVEVQAGVGDEGRYELVARVDGLEVGHRMKARSHINGHERGMVMVRLAYFFTGGMEGGVRFFNQCRESEGDESGGRAAPGPEENEARQG